MLHTRAQAHHLALARLLALASEQQPRAVDRPVAQVAVARHAERGADLAARVNELHDVGRLGVEFGGGGGAAGATGGGALVEFVGGFAAWFETFGVGGLDVGFGFGFGAWGGCGEGAGHCWSRRRSYRCRCLGGEEEGSSRGGRRRGGGEGGGCAEHGGYGTHRAAAAAASERSEKTADIEFGRHCWPIDV